MQLVKKYFPENPQSESKIFWQLVKRTLEEVREEIWKKVPSPLNDNVSYSASAACYPVAQQSGILEDFGAQARSDLLRLAVQRLHRLL